MHVTGWCSRSGRCPTIQVHAAANWQRRRPASLRQQRNLRKLHTMPHAVDPGSGKAFSAGRADLLEHVVAAQAALSTAGLMFASAALGLAGGRRMASPSPEDAAGIRSTSSNPNKTLHVPARSSSGSSTSVLSSSDGASSIQDVSMQSASAETAPAQNAEGRATIASIQSDSTAGSSSFLSAEQLWEGAWKAFEEPEQKQGLSRPGTRPGALEREQQLDSQHQSSFPSLAARFFGTHSASQDRRKRGQQPGQSLEQAGRPDQDVWAKPHLALQGIAPAARIRLLACALASIEKQISSLPDALDMASPEQWRLATQAITASCAVTSARAWIGYIPQGLIEDAQEALQQLAAHDTVADDAETSADADTRSSLRQLLTQALPSEVQSSLKPVTQPAESKNNCAADKEPREQTPLESLQIEKAHIHGALVSYLKCGWQASNANQSKSRSESADSRVTVFAQSSVSGDQSEVCVSGRIVEQRSEVEQLEPSSSDPGRQRSRRAVAMAALEGRHHSMSPGGSADGQAGVMQQAPMVLRCGAAVLQDMAVAVADAAADAYLAEAGVRKGGGSQGSTDPGLAADTWLLVLHPRLTTTRSLERFRNQVAMQRWMEANFGSVAAMYEDRHQLWGFNHKGRLLQRTMPARRAQELGSLTGLRSYYSTALEAFDFLAPLLERLFTRIGDAVAWLLVRLIGRSLGLIYRGVRESLVPRQRPPVAKRGRPPRWAPL